MVSISLQEAAKGLQEAEESWEKKQKSVPFLFKAAVSFLVIKMVACWKNHILRGGGESKKGKNCLENIGKDTILC